MVALALIRDDVRAIEAATRKASRISWATDAMVRVTRAVEHEWDVLPECDRELLRGVARLFVTPPRQSITTRVRFAWWRLRSDMSELEEFILAGVRLRDALLDVVEREHPKYDAFVADALAEAVRSPGTRVKPGKIGEWLASVRDSGQ